MTKKKAHPKSQNFSLEYSTPGTFNGIVLPLFWLSASIFANVLLLKFYFDGTIFNGGLIDIFAATIWIVASIPILFVIFSLLYICFQAATNRDFFSKAPSAGEASIIKAIEENAAELARKKIQLTVKNEYGVVNFHRWDKELERYVREILPQKVPSHDHSSAILFLHKKGSSERIRNMIDEKVREIENQNATIDDLSPLEFERYISKRLETLGWSTSTTKASGDQGADVLANKDGVSLVIQCKLYSKPVGNKAVQEAIAAQKFYLTDMAAVVTNQSFTKSARDLANMGGVLVLHHTEMDVFS